MANGRRGSVDCRAGGRRSGVAGGPAAAADGGENHNGSGPAQNGRAAGGIGRGNAGGFAGQR